MNAQFNGTNACTPKKLAKQLIVELSKSITNQQRQALLDIYIALDRTETAQNQFYQNNDNVYAETKHNSDFAMTEKHPATWLKRTQKHTPKHYSFSYSA